jgi:valyl-tRNA synthetase
MPFITEELYQDLNKNLQVQKSIMFDESLNGISDFYTKKEEENEKIISDFETVKEIIANIRTIRQQKNISPKEKLNLQITGEHNAEFDEVIKKLANVDIAKTTEKQAGTVSFLVGTTEYTIPLNNLINVEEEIKKIESEIKYYEGFLAAVMKKLSNEQFVANAKPEVVEMERKKQSDAESKLKSLNESLMKLRN